jgi:hypothetical protein
MRLSDAIAQSDPARPNVQRVSRPSKRQIVPLDCFVGGPLGLLTDAARLLP